MALETTFSDLNEQTFLYRFLVSPKFRIARHVFLFFSLFVISFNQVYISFQDLITESEIRMYPLTLYILLTYIFVAYFNLYYLLPSYLLTKRYGAYIVLLLLSVACVWMAQIYIENILYRYWLPEYEQSSFLSLPLLADSISGFLLTALCLIGGSMTALLKLWMINNRRVSQLERERVLAEVEHLKEQFSPVLLFKTLKRAGQLAAGEPGKASQMLRKLGWLLRYQVHDCKRDTVPLRSVINYLTHYLMLEQFDSGRFEFMVSIDGDTKHTMVPPLLFIPFVQYTVERIYAQKDGAGVSVHVRMEVSEEEIRFLCTCSDIDLSGGEGLERIIQRLALQYGDHHRLELTGEGIRLELRNGGVI